MGYSNFEIQEAVDTAKRNHLDEFLFQNPFGRRRSKCMCNKCRKSRQEAAQEEVEEMKLCDQVLPEEAEEMKHYDQVAQEMKLCDQVLPEEDERDTCNCRRRSTCGMS